jgi:hypothetical protein
MWHKSVEEELILEKDVNLYDDDRLILMLDKISNNVGTNIIRGRWDKFKDAPDAGRKIRSVEKFGNNYITDDNLHELHKEETENICKAAIDLGHEWLETYFNRWEDDSHAVVNHVRRVPPFANREGKQLGIHKLWGYKIIDGFEGIAHNHWPHMLNFVYYMDASDPIHFPYLDMTIDPYPGLMIMFRGNVFHKVIVENTNVRYVLAGSLRYTDVA